jgi:plasmid stability protein
MATIIIRDLDDEVRGTSVEQEARRLLTEGTKLSRKEIAAEAAAMRARLPQLTLRQATAAREA